MASNDAPDDLLANMKALLLQSAADQHKHLQKQLQQVHTKLNGLAGTVRDVGHQQRARHVSIGRLEHGGGLSLAEIEAEASATAEACAETDARDAAETLAETVTRAIEGFWRMMSHATARQDIGILGTGMGQFGRVFGVFDTVGV